jgi:hypothetical protein
MDFERTMKHSGYDKIFDDQLAANVSAYSDLHV